MFLDSVFSNLMWQWGYENFKGFLSSFFLFLKILFIFREKGGKKRENHRSERETSTDWLHPAYAPNPDQTAT